MTDLISLRHIAEFVHFVNPVKMIYLAQAYMLFYPLVILCFTQRVLPSRRSTFLMGASALFPPLLMLILHARAFSLLIPKYFRVRAWVTRVLSWGMAACATVVVFVCVLGFGDISSSFPDPWRAVLDVSLFWPSFALWTVILGGHVRVPIRWTLAGLLVIALLGSVIRANIYHLYWITPPNWHDAVTYARENRLVDSMDYPALPWAFKSEAKPDEGHYWLWFSNGNASKWIHLAWKDKDGNVSFAEVQSAN